MNVPFVHGYKLFIIRYNNASALQTSSYCEQIRKKKRRERRTGYITIAIKDKKRQNLSMEMNFNEILKHIKFNACSYLFSHPI